MGLPKANDNRVATTQYNILFIIALCHLLNDSIQAVIPAMFPILERSMNLSYTQLGFIGFSLNFVSSIMQPLVGYVADKRPTPYVLPIALTSTFIGIIGLALAPSYALIICSVLLIGFGSAMFHPEASRVTYLAAGPRRGLAQSIFQVGGNSGSALGPVITALILVPLGQVGAIWFGLVALTAVLFLTYIAKWYKQIIQTEAPLKKTHSNKDASFSKAIIFTLTIIVLLVFVRSWYISSITNFYSFYAIETYGVSIADAQSFLFLFLLFGAIGTFVGGPLADRYGKRNIIFLSMVASTPLAIVLPFAPKILAYVLISMIGFILMSSFSVTVVYAQELMPANIGMMSGFIVGLAFGMGAIGSVALGAIADTIGLVETIILIGFLPLFGILTFLLPADKTNMM
ncbi:MFS transporter [Bacillus sp. HMF5848]|uniref:MFS transporter n=1 Tax=Bacillus sp. HMF5848 TaxID=2495421 RepID=UPI000F7BA00D|nr:MFS transporter [Bacillus sp. HMF5848]RSK26721.1 MFS transporter [Bacillus sp. HMF5848]